MSKTTFPSSPIGARRRASPAMHLAWVALAGLTLAGCNALTRLSQVGEEPTLSAIENPAKLQGNQPVTMPMPAPVAVQRQANSLWRPG